MPSQAFEGTIEPTDEDDLVFSMEAVLGQTSLAAVALGLTLEMTPQEVAMLRQRTLDLAARLPGVKLAMINADLVDFVTVLRRFTGQPPFPVESADNTVDLSERAEVAASTPNAESLPADSNTVEPAEVARQEDQVVEIEPVSPEISPSDPKAIVEHPPFNLTEPPTRGMREMLWGVYPTDWAARIGKLTKAQGCQLIYSLLELWRQTVEPAQSNFGSVEDRLKLVEQATGLYGKAVPYIELAGGHHSRAWRVPEAIKSVATDLKKLDLEVLKQLYERAVS